MDDPAMNSPPTAARRATWRRAAVGTAALAALAFVVGILTQREDEEAPRAVGPVADVAPAAAPLRPAAPLEVGANERSPGDFSSDAPGVPNGANAFDLAGRVQTADGVAMRGVRVRLHVVRHAVAIGERPADGSIGEAESREDGGVRFRLPGPGTYELRMRDDAGDARPIRLHVVRPLADVVFRFDRVDPHLLRIRVLENEQLVDPESLAATPSSVRFEREDRGTYAYRGAERVVHVVATRAGAIGIATVSSPPEGVEAQVGIVRLARPGVLRATVIGAEGLEGTLVARNAGYERSATLRGGVARIEELPPGPFTVTVIGMPAHRAPPRRVDVPSGAEVAVTLELLPGCTVRGKLLPPAPVVPCQATLLALDDDANAPKGSSDFGAGPVTMVRLEQGATGSSKAVTGGTYEFVGLAPGRFRVFVAGEGTTCDVRDIRLAVGEVVELEHRLEPGASLHGLAWARRIQLACDDDRPLRLPVRSGGAFGAEGLRRTRYEVHAVGDGDTLIPLGQVDLRARSHEFVDYRDLTRVAMRFRTWPGARVEWGERTAVADVAGTATMPALFGPSRRESVLVHHEGMMAAFTVQEWTQFAGGFEVSLPTTLTSVRVRPPASDRLTAVAWRSAGPSGQGAVRLLSARGEVLPSGGAPESIDLAVPPGSLSLDCAFAGGARSQTNVVVGAEPLDVALEGASVVATARVRVVDGMGVPVQGALVAAFADDGKAVGGPVATDGDGFAEVRARPGDALELRVVGSRNVQTALAMRRDGVQLPRTPIKLGVAGSTTEASLVLR